MAQGTRESLEITAVIKKETLDRKKGIALAHALGHTLGVPGNTPQLTQEIQIMTTSKTPAVSNDTRATVDKAAANAALSAISRAVNGQRGAKRQEKEKVAAERMAARRATLLTVLSTGETGAKSVAWNYKWALIKSVSALKNGATGEQLEACTALHTVAPWADLVQPVIQFATAKGLEPDQVKTLVNSLCKPAKAATEKAVESKPAKAASKTSKPAKGRKAA